MLFWRNPDGEWIHVRDHVCQLQADLENVYVVDDEDRSIWKWVYSEPFNWNKIGGPAQYIYAIEKQIWYNNKNNDKHYLYTGKDDVWTEHDMLRYQSKKHKH